MGANTFRVCYKALYVQRALLRAAGGTLIELLL